MNARGLTLVELLVAMVVLGVGVLGLAAGTGWMVRSVDLTRIETARSAALQAGIEQVRSTPFASVDDGTTTEGDFEIRWRVVSESPNWKHLEFVLEGPGRVRGSTGTRPAISDAVADTLEYRVIRP